MTENQFRFRISSQLKNIIGRDLINDDFIAVFELVKNSYDAYASKVDIFFENIYSNNPKIIITDNGIGMDKQDLIDKWLFVAYSAKKDTILNEESHHDHDYRNKINIRRTYAGSKGIGRFSCDRLGSNLYLKTKKIDTDLIDTLFIDWAKFDQNFKDEFVNIDVIHKSVASTDKNYDHGTILEITELHSEWNREKLLKLKDALAKLINPKKNDLSNEFRLYLHVTEEKGNDKNFHQYREIVNGEIKNTIFDTLERRTTKIETLIDELTITTSLYEDGKRIYKIIESNIFKSLMNIKFELYFLNRSAKVTFKRRMGIDSVNYGHIFMYKNGIRIYPYGERGADPLKMDVRKAQGHNRFLGTREVIGYIEIEGENYGFTETSSRGDGFIRTRAVAELEESFYTTLKRLEKYIIDITDWGNDLSNDDFINLNNKEKATTLEKLLKNLTKSKNLIDFKIDSKIIALLEEKQKKSAIGILGDVKKEVNSTAFDKKNVLKKINEAEVQINTLKKLKEEIEEENDTNIQKVDKLNCSLESEIRKSIFQKSIIGTEKEQILGFQHQIRHSSSMIKGHIDLLLKYLDSSSLNEKVKKIISKISLEASKIESIANFVTKANFNLTTDYTLQDIVQFITEYINELYEDTDAFFKSETCTVKAINMNRIGYFIKFRPLEVTTMIDNFIQNAKKANASEIIFDFKKADNGLIIDVKNNGVCINPEILSKIYDFGFTTTNGSGIGLSHIKDIVNNINGNISVSSDNIKGTVFTIILKQR